MPGRILFIRIRQFSISHFQKRRQCVLFEDSLAHDVGDMPPLDGEGIGDKRAVAAPGQGLGTHDGHALLTSEGFQFDEARVEGRCGHVVGIASKGGVAPTGIGRIFGGMAQPSQGFQVKVADARSIQFTGQAIYAKLGMRARPGDGAHINQLLDVISMEEFQKLL